MAGVKPRAEMDEVGVLDWAPHACVCRERHHRANSQTFFHGAGKPTPWSAAASPMNQNDLTDLGEVNYQGLVIVCI